MTTATRFLAKTVAAVLFGSLVSGMALAANLSLPVAVVVGTVAGVVTAIRE